METAELETLTKRQLPTLGISLLNLSHSHPQCQERRWRLATPLPCIWPQHHAQVFAASTASWVSRKPSVSAHQEMKAHNSWGLSPVPTCLSAADPGAYTVILLTKASPVPQQQEKALCAHESLRELQDGSRHYGEHWPSASQGRPFPWHSEAPQRLWSAKDCVKPRR